MEGVDEWLKQSPKQMAIAIRELTVTFREAREPIWTNIDDERILEIAKAQWFLSNPAIMWGFCISHGTKLWITPKRKPKIKHKMAGKTQ